MLNNDWFFLFLFLFVNRNVIECIWLEVIWLSWGLVEILWDGWSIKKEYWCYERSYSWVWGEKLSSEWWIEWEEEKEEEKEGEKRKVISCRRSRVISDGWFYISGKWLWWRK